MKHLLILLLLLSSTSLTFAQEDSELVEVYGLIATKNEAGRFEYVPFVTIGVEGTTRGTYANYQGMYSIVVKKGQKITFNAIGYKDLVVTVPADVAGLYYSLPVTLESAPVVLEEVTVFPWPDRNNLSAEFLALQPTRSMELENIARENLDKNQLIAIANATDPDGKESASYYLRKQTSDYSYQGQVAPQSIFDPLAWGKFFKQFKKKELTEKEKRMIKILEGENE
jgi:hypothetical protein